MATNIDIILDWFRTGKKPTQSQFWASWQSFWHKNEIIPITTIENLTEILDAKANDAGVVHIANNETIVGVKTFTSEVTIPDGTVPTSAVNKSQIDLKADLIDGKIPASQLPSSSTSVFEFDSFEDFPASGISGKIYIAKDTNLMYRWSDSAYVTTGSSLSLGEIATTAYRGDRGKMAYDHSQATGNPHNTQLTDISGLSAALAGKQATLTSGTNIKSVNGTSLLGNGDVAIVQNSLTASTTLSPSVTAVNTALALKANDTNVVHTSNSETIGGIKTFTSEVIIPSGTAATSAVNKGQIDLKADLVAGKIPASQLPSYVDDVLEFANLAAFPATGETGKLYIAIDTNLIYRWSGSTYVVTSSSLALGETAATAYRGDRGKIAYDHSQATGNPHNTQVADISGLSATLTGKQATLVSGTNIKTVGGQSLVGSGNITEVQDNLTASTSVAPSVNAVNTALALKTNTNGSNASGTWPVSITGTAVNSNNWIPTLVDDFDIPTGFKLLQANSGALNRPGDGLWGTGIQFTTASNPAYACQLVIDVNGVPYLRNKFNGVFGSWNKITLDINTIKVIASPSLNNAGDTYRNNYTWFDYNYAGLGAGGAYAGSVISFSGLNGNGRYAVQLFSNYDNGNNIIVRTRNGDGAGTWNTPRRLWHNTDFTLADIASWNAKANLAGGNNFTGAQNIKIDSETDVSVITLVNGAFDINATTGESKIKFGFQDVLAGIGAYRQTNNTAGIKFFTAYGYNNDIERGRITNVGNWIIGASTDADTGDKLQVNGKLRINTTPGTAGLVVTRGGNEGVEIFPTSAGNGTFVLQNYDRTGLAYKPLILAGSKIVTNQGNLIIDSTNLNPTDTGEKLQVNSGTIAIKEPPSGTFLTVKRSTFGVQFGVSSLENGYATYTISGNALHRVFGNGNTIIGSSIGTDSGYKLDVQGISRSKRIGANGGGLATSLIVASDAKTVSDAVGVFFQALNSSNTDVNYGLIAVNVEAIAAGAQSGSMVFRTVNNGAYVTALTLTKEGNLITNTITGTTGSFTGQLTIPAGITATSAVNLDQLNTKANNDEVVHLTGDESKTGNFNISGNVGIGTTSPSAKLHVNGTGSFTGIVKVPNGVNATDAVNKGQLDLLSSSVISVTATSLTLPVTNKETTIVFNGSSAAGWQVPVGGQYLGFKYTIINKTSAIDVTLNLATGSFWLQGATPTGIKVSPRQTVTIINDGTHWSVLNIF